MTTVEDLPMQPDATERPFSRVRRDIQRYSDYWHADGRIGFWQGLRLLLDEPGLQAVVVYRFGFWVDRRVRFPLLRYPLKLLYYILHKLVIVLWGIYIDSGAEIGAGFYVGHFGGIIVGPGKIGRDCNIAPGVIIGRRAGSVASGVPTLGDRVWVGAHSVLFDGITIGDGVTIGPLTVVGRNLPPRVLVIGNPLRVLRKDYDNSAEIYGRTTAPPSEEQA